jgi:hypothetical protein
MSTREIGRLAGLLGAALLGACGATDGTVGTPGVGAGTVERGSHHANTAQDANPDPDPVKLEAQAAAEGRGLEGGSFPVETSIPTDPVPEPPESSTEPIGRERSAVGTYITRYYASGTAASEILQTQLQDVCVMSGFTGSIRCPSGSQCSSFRVGVNSDGRIDAQKSSYGMGAYLTCYPRTTFSPPFYEMPYQYNFLWDQCERISGTTGYYGDTAIALTGFGYNFSALNNLVWVTQGNSPSDANGWGMGAAVSPCRVVNFWSNIYANNGYPIRFHGPNGDGSAAQAGEFDISAGHSQNLDVALAPANNLCYYTYIAGDIHTTSDTSQIFGVSPTGAQHVSLHTSSAGSMRVKLRCIPYAQ